MKTNMSRIFIFILFILTIMPIASALAALVIDASSPATIKSNAATLTTASFTPPAGSVLSIIITINSNLPGNCSGSPVCQNKITSVTDNLGVPLTYTKVLSEGTEEGTDAISYLYTAPVVTSQAMTVSAAQQSTQSLARYAMMKVLVITGANTTSPVGANGGNRGATGVISDNYTSTVANSWGWLIYADWNVAAIPTAGSGQTVYDSYQQAGEDTYALIQQDSATPTSGTSVTMSTTAPTSGAQTSHLYFEMAPASTTQVQQINGDSVIAGVSRMN